MLGFMSNQAGFSISIYVCVCVAGATHTPRMPTAYTTNCLDTASPASKVKVVQPALP